MLTTLTSSRMSTITQLAAHKSQLAPLQRVTPQWLFTQAAFFQELAL